MSNNYLVIFGLVLFVLILVSLFVVKTDSAKGIQGGYLYVLFLTIVCGVFVLLVVYNEMSEYLK